jgi:hypothetical protein
MIKNSDGDISKNVIYPFIGSDKCCLNENETYFYFKNNVLEETGNQNILNA